MPRMPNPILRSTHRHNTTNTTEQENKSPCGIPEPRNLTVYNPAPRNKKKQAQKLNRFGAVFTSNGFCISTYLDLILMLPLVDLWLTTFLVCGCLICQLRLQRTRRLAKTPSKPYLSSSTTRPKEVQPL